MEIDNSLADTQEIPKKQRKAPRQRRLTVAEMRDLALENQNFSQLPYSAQRLFELLTDTAKLRSQTIKGVFKVLATGEDETHIIIPKKE